MKPKYLLDECVSSRAGFFDYTFAQSVDLVGRGATDDQVLEYSKSHKMIIVTKDRGLVLKTILGNNPIIYSCKENTALIIPKKVELNRKYADPVTFYLQKSQSVIIA